MLGGGGEGAKGREEAKVVVLEGWGREEEGWEVGMGIGLEFVVERLGRYQGGEVKRRGMRKVLEVLIRFVFLFLFVLQFEILTFSQN